MTSSHCALQVPCDKTVLNSMGFSNIHCNQDMAKRCQRNVVLHCAVLVAANLLKPADPMKVDKTWKTRIVVDIPELMTWAHCVTCLISYHTTSIMNIDETHGATKCTTWKPSMDQMQSLKRMRVSYLSYFLVYCLLQGLSFVVQWVLYKVNNLFKFKARKTPFHTETLALTYAPPLDLEHTIHPGLESNLAV